MARQSRTRSLLRRTGIRPERTTLVVFTEGYTEWDYIVGLRRLPAVSTRFSIEIKTGHGTDPLTLVANAVKSSTEPEVDECWCMFDVESPTRHEHLMEAMALARKHGVHVAVSNPCFEAWMIFHSERRTTHLSTADAIARSEHLNGRTGKRIAISDYLPLLTKAVENAEYATEWHKRNGTNFPDDNPSSTMPDFLRRIGAA